MESFGNEVWFQHDSKSSWQVKKYFKSFFSFIHNNSIVEPKDKKTLSTEELKRKQTEDKYYR